MFRVVHFLFGVVLWLGKVTAGSDDVVASNVSISVDTNVAALVDWLRSRGGIFNEKMEIRKVNPDDEESVLGIFAKEDIKATELLLHIPTNCLITAGPPVVGDRVLVNHEAPGTWKSGVVDLVETESGNEIYSVVYDDGEKRSTVSSDALHKDMEGGIVCDAIHNLIKEVKLGEESEYAPFVAFLLEQKIDQPLSTWSQAGKNLLNGILQNDLPPLWATQWSLSKKCVKSGNPLEAQAAMIQLLRGWGDVLVPLYDIMRHRNGQYLNTVHDKIMWSKSVVVRASRDIIAGEEIHTSYNFCSDCAGKEGDYGTGEILRDYGFIEPLPQLWFFPKYDIAFSLEELPEGGFKVKWNGGEPQAEGITYMEGQLWRLKDIVAKDLKSPDPNLPRNELTTISW